MIMGHPLLSRLPLLVCVCVCVSSLKRGLGMETSSLKNRHGLQSGYSGINRAGAAPHMW